MVLRTSILLLAGLTIGCSSLHYAHFVDPGILIQEGKAPIHSLMHNTVYYSVPYLSPPNLEVTYTDGRKAVVKITEQREDRFSFDVDALGNGVGETVSWTARGCVPKSLASQHATSITNSPEETPHPPHGQ